MYIYTCVYVYVCVHVYIHMYTYMCIHIYSSTKQIYIYIYIYSVDMYTCTLYTLSTFNDECTL